MFAMFNLDEGALLSSLREKIDLWFGNYVQISYEYTRNLCKSSPQSFEIWLLHHICSPGPIRAF